MNDLTFNENNLALPVSGVENQIREIQKLMSSCMKHGEHYGQVPGTTKPTLLKAGAEKLGFMFRLLPKFEIIMAELLNDHREYRVKCILTRPNGDFAGEGLGTCSTMESKYRYRGGYTITDMPIPKDYRENKAMYKKNGFGAKKIDDRWAWVEYNEKTENTNIADTYNTVLKMAKKRAHVDAVITATAASDIFTQDIEDFPDTQLETLLQNTEKKLDKALDENISEDQNDDIIEIIRNSSLSEEDKSDLIEEYYKKPDKIKPVFKDHILFKLEKLKNENT